MLYGHIAYKAYEPAEGGMHQGTGRARRIRAGLWRCRACCRTDREARRALDERYYEDRGYAPPTQDQAAEVVHSESSLSDSDDTNHFTVPGAFEVQFEPQHNPNIVRFRKGKRKDDPLNMA
ncbi:hypothetical protein FRC12_002601 [Ceratobasidium sp. 428]|nr:hypothetical protein FRC12_002601 [Ceratobasidium sp. 428]